MKKLVYHPDSKPVLYLIDKDPKLKSLIEKKPEIIVPIDDDYFVSLVQIIIAQQLSSKVANVITQRVFSFFDKKITPQNILSADVLDLRGLGLSSQKITYVRSLASCVAEGKVKLDNLDHMTDEEVIDMLTEIKGIGRWSAQMFLIFSLGREDVFSVHDLGLRQAVMKLYEIPELSLKDIEEIAQQWAPFRSVASHYLWHAWDNE